MDDPLAGQFVDQRDRLLQRGPRAVQIVAVNGGPDRFQRAAQPAAKLPVTFAMLETLTVRLLGGCVRSHWNFTTSKTLYYSMFAALDGPMDAADE